MESKKCTICLYERPIDDFNYANAINGIRPNGTPNYWCVSCVKKYNRVKNSCGTGDQGTKKWIKLQQAAALMEGRSKP